MSVVLRSVPVVEAPEMALSARVAGLSVHGAGDPLAVCDDCGQDTVAPVVRYVLEDDRGSRFVESVCRWHDVLGA